MSKSLTILIGVLFSLTLLASAFHHHPDLNDHPTCVFCKVAKDLASSEHTPSHQAETPSQQMAVLARTSSDEPGRVFVLLSNDRAPPCLL